MYKITALSNEGQEHITKASNRISAGLKAYSLVKEFDIESITIECLLTDSKEVCTSFTLNKPSHEWNWERV